MYNISGQFLSDGNGGHISIIAGPVLGNLKQVEKSYDYEYMKPWLGNGLLTSSRRTWHPRRKALTPAFHLKVLTDFIHIFQKQADVMMTLLETEDGKLSGFDIVPYITLCTLDIFCETAMGCQVHAQKESNSEYVQAHKMICQVIRNRLQKFWLHPDSIFKWTNDFQKHQQCIKVLHTFSNQIVLRRKQELLRHKIKNVEQEMKKNSSNTATNSNSRKNKQLALLDLLIEDSDLSDIAIREEIDTFIVGGHDTTAASIAWILYLLGENQDIQTRVIHEIDNVMRGDRERVPTIKELNEMRYLECCIKEGLRLYPSIPVIARRLTEDVQVDKFVVPAGTTAMIVLHNLHRDTSVFNNPEKYNPDNFLPENCSGRHPFAYIPFSAGPRNCIGQKFAILEEKSILTAILRKYHIDSVNRREDIQLLCDLVLRPKNGLFIKICKRN